MSKSYITAKKCKSEEKTVKLQTMQTISEEYNSSSSFEDTGIVHITAAESSTHLTVTTVLNYCKSKILKPYLRFLSFMGLRSLLNEQNNSSICLRIFNSLYIIQAIAFVVVGFVLQYMSCFRREKGFGYVSLSENKTLQAVEYDAILKETCEGSVVFSFALPSLLHLLAYLHIVFVFRNTDDEQLPILMERVFLASTTISNGFISQRRLVRTLWLVFTISLIWMTMSFTVLNYMMLNGDVHFKWTKRSFPNLTILLKVMLVFSTLWHDLIQCTIISNYCLQAQLLTSYVKFMRERLLQFPVPPLEWMRDIEDFKKLLHYFNKKISPSICLLTIMNLSFAISGIIWIICFDVLDKGTVSVVCISILNVVLWAIMVIAPFLQAARLTNSCEVLRTVGQEVRARPYVHQDTPTMELDSVLLYTTSLNINAKLFYVPITGQTLSFCLTIGTVALLTFGQCRYIFLLN